LRIINGTVVQRPSEKYSYFALPTQSPGTDMWLGCGASIISPTFGVTAAHCFGGGLRPCSDSRHIALWLGDVQLVGGRRVAPLPGGTSFRVEAERICHPNFDGKCSHGHDIALLKLSKPLPAWISPVALDLNGMLGAGLNQSHVAIGFGSTESMEDPTTIDGPSLNLREVSLVVHSSNSSACSREFSGGWGCSDEYSEGVAENKEQQICVGTGNEPLRDTCSGDSGSPLLGPSGAQVGIVSYGGGPGQKASGPGRYCGDPEFPGVYTRVSALADFVREHVHDIPESIPNSVIA